MEIDDRLRALLLGCTWARDPALALQVVPGLALDCPPLQVLHEGGPPVVPTVAAGPVLRALATVLPGLVEAAVDGSSAEAVHRLAHDALTEDPLVSVVADLLTHAADPRTRAHLVPPLVVAWCVSRVFGGPASDLAFVDAQAAASLGRLRALPREAAQRGAALARLGWSVAARVGAGLELARRSGVPVDGSGLLRAMLPNRLVLTLPRPPRGEAPDLSLVASTLGLPLDATVVGHVFQAAEVAVGAARARAQAGRGVPADAALAALGLDLDVAGEPPEATARTARSFLFHPVTGPLLLATLPAAADAGALDAAGLPPSFAGALADPAAVRALAATWCDLVRALLGWDVLAVLRDAVSPVREEGGRWTSPAGPLAGDLAWRCLLPRAESAPVAVLAADLSRVGAAAVQVGRRADLARWALEQAWQRRARAAGTELVAVVAGRAVAVLGRPTVAAELAIELGAAFSGPGRLDLGGRAGELVLPSSCRTPMGLAWGPLDGGTDGATVSLSGAVVGRAVALAGTDGTSVGTTGVDDPLRIRRAGLAAGGLANDGVLVDPAFLGALLDDLPAAGRRCHRRGTAATAAGLSADFQVYPVEAWWEHERGVVVALRLGGGAGGESAAELQLLSREAFRELHEGDARLARRPAQAARPEPEAPSADLFGFAADEPDTDEGAPEPLFGFVEEEDEPAPVPSAPAGFGDVAAADSAALEGPTDGFEPPLLVGALALLDGDDVDRPEAVPGSPEVPEDGIDFDLAAAFEAEALGRAPELDSGPEPSLFDPGDIEEVFVVPDYLRADEEDPTRPEGGGGWDGFGDGDGPEVELTDTDPDDVATEVESRIAPPMILDGEEGDAASFPFEEAGQDGPKLEIEDDWEEEEDEPTGGVGSGFGPLDADDLIQPEPLAPSGGGSVAAEVVRLLERYVVVADGRSFVFGLKEGGRLVDVHSYDTAGDETEAYRQFLRAKIGDGFVPRAERTQPLAQLGRPQAVERPKLERACEEVMSR